jgi:hypothetical protein
MEYSEGAVQLVWIVSLIIAVVVVGVVALLLHLVRETAKDIDQVAGDIWTQGKLVANNTIHIPTFLSKTNSVFSKIYENAVQILQGSAAIKQHAEECPGCPDCILKHN